MYRLLVALVRLAVRSRRSKDLEYRISYRFLVPGWSAKPLVSAHDRIMGTHRLGYRMQDRSGKKSSDLDYVRPTRWTQTYELLLVLSIIEHTIKATPKAADLLERILSGPLIPASDLPCPTSAERKPPKTGGTELGI